MSGQNLYFTPIDTIQDGEVKVYSLFCSPKPVNGKSVEMETFLYKHGLQTNFLIVQITALQSVCAFAERERDLVIWAKHKPWLRGNLQSMWGVVNDKLREDGKVIGDCWWMPMGDEQMKELDRIISEVEHTWEA